MEDPLNLADAASPPQVIDGPPPAKPRRRIGDVLVEAKVCSRAQVDEAFAYTKEHGGRLGAALINLGYLTEDQLKSSLSSQLGLATCEVESLCPPEEMMRLLPEDFVRQREVIPLGMEGRGLVLGMTNPGDELTLIEVRKLTGYRFIEPRLVGDSSFRRFVEMRYPPRVVFERLEVDGLGDAVRALRGEIDFDGKPLVGFIDWLLKYAVEERASDIHIEPYDEIVRIRLRVDGALKTILAPPAKVATSIASRLKVMAHMDIAERRKPQDGHILLETDDEELHFRVSSLPIVHGEKVVIRLLKKEAHLADLARLGFSPAQLAVIKRVAAMPQGLIRVTGPTGSGKTTTLHAVLNHINDPDINVVTIEDPVEQTLPGINHVQVTEKGGVTFAAALRSILRQDPDVVFVGEMRDPEVAAIAVKAALTGHLVLSTLHTNGTVESFTRLGDMGIPPYLVATSVQLVVAQRLVRRLCTKCARVAPVPQATIDRFQLRPEQVKTALHKLAVGCDACNRSGYRGRVAVYEMVAPGAALRECIRTGKGEAEMAQAAKEGGAVFMWEAGIARALAGETSFDEVLRTIPAPDAE